MRKKEKFIGDLDDAPVGEYGVWKKLYIRTDKHGNTCFGIYEYVPRPVFPRRAQMPEYVRGRGIVFSESEIKAVCTALRNNMYEEWNMEDPDSDDEIDKLISGINKETDEIRAGKPVDLYDFEDVCIAGNDIHYSSDPDDPIPMGDVYEELGYDLYMNLITFGDGKHGDAVKEVNLVSWREQPIAYDLREFKNKKNSRGYFELTPKLNKGITLDDYEANELCSYIEALYPEQKGANAFADCDIDREYEKHAKTFRVPVNHDEWKCIEKAFDIIDEKLLNESVRKCQRGCGIAERDENKVFGYLGMLRRKWYKHERMYDTEAQECVNLFNDALEYIDDFETRETLSIIIETLENELYIRNRLPKPEWETREIKTLTMSRGEFETAHDVIKILYDNLYNTDADTEAKQNMRAKIDKLAIEDIEFRNHGGKYMTDEYKEEPGRFFLETLIQAMQNSADSPFSERP